MEDQVNTQQCSSKTPFIVGGILLVVVAGYFLLSKSNTSESKSPATATSETQVSQPKTGGSTNTQSEFDKRFVAYSTENLAKATNNGRAVVFFHASWCPMCSEAEADLKSNWEKVPQNITILKTDYDSSKELKTKYGVISQDTWIQVDSQGKTIVKWNSGGKGLSALLANLK